jgi:hypothetical protein
MHVLAVGRRSGSEPAFWMQNGGYSSWERENDYLSIFLKTKDHYYHSWKKMRLLLLGPPFFVTNTFPDSTTP